MKSKLAAGVALVFLLGAVFCFSCPGEAAEMASSRDSLVDAALSENAYGAGLLPATGASSLGASAVSSGSPSRDFVDPVLAAGRGAGSAVPSSGLTDKRARVYDLKGDVKTARSGSDGWAKLRKNAWIAEGDIILTGKKSFASLAFDEKFLNVTHVPENTRAFFRSIEPTDIVIEDGTLYNIFEGLPPGSGWKISSPVAVAAVRGTRYLVRYLASDGRHITAVFDVPDDGEASEVSLIEILDDGSEGKQVNIPEGFQIELAAGESPDPAMLEIIDAKWLDEIRNFLKQLDKERDDRQGGLLPPTSGEFFDPNVIDPAGGGVGGSPDTPLDPLIDTGTPADTLGGTAEDPGDDSKDPENEYPYDEGY